MPCYDPPGSWDYIEQDENQKKYGKHWTNTQMAMNVACEYANCRAYSRQIPEWVTKWCDNHVAEDKKRDEEKHKQEEIIKAKKKIQFLKFKKELGL